MNILEKITGTKKEEVKQLKKKRDINSLRAGANSQTAPRNFLKAIQRSHEISLIGELKKASPSKGVLRADFQIEPMARAYAQGGARALSVLTDIQYFQGDLSYLKMAKEASGLPILRKDFLIDEVQVYESREAGADAILLIAAILPKAQLKELMMVAAELSMASLVEVHDEKELETALKVGAKMIGINNRNLNDFSVTLQTSFDLLKKCPKGLPVVSESGIFTRQDALSLKEAGAAAILVGEVFMTSPDIETTVRAILPRGN